MYSKKLAQSIHFIQAGYALCDSPEGGVAQGGKTLRLGLGSELRRAGSLHNKPGKPVSNRNYFIDSCSAGIPRMTVPTTYGPIQLQGIYCRNLEAFIPEYFFGNSQPFFTMWTQPSGQPLGDNQLYR